MCRKIIYILPGDPELYKQLKSIQKQQNRIRYKMTVILVGIAVVVLEIKDLREALQRSRKRQDN